MNESAGKRLSMTYRSLNSSPNPELERLLVEKSFNETKLLKEL